MRIVLIILIALWVISCGKKREGHVTGHEIKVQAAVPLVVAADSLQMPAVFSLKNARISKIPISKHSSATEISNIRVAGKPVIIKAGTPRQRIPGQDSCAFPKVVAAVDSTFPAGHPEWIEAREMARKEINGASVSYFSKLEGLKHDEIWCILEDHVGNIWFGTNTGGVTRYDGKYFTHFTTKEGLINDQVQCMMEDSHGNIWFGTSTGVSKYDGKSFTNYTGRQGLSGDAVQAMLEDHRGNIWFGIYGGGVTKYDGRNFYQYTVTEGLGDNNVSCIFEDQAANLWFGSFGGGVTRFNGNSFDHFTTADGLGSDVLLSIEQDLKGNIWFGTAGGGVTRYDGNFFSTYSTEQGLIDNSVGYVAVDHIGNLWFATQSGLCSFDGMRFTTYTMENGLSTNLVYAIAEDRSGNIWVATGGGGVCRIGGVNFTHMTARDGLINSSIYSILEESGGTRWFGTEDGLVRWDGSVIENYKGNDDSSFRLWIHSIEKDRSGKIWIGVDKRAFVWFDGVSFNELSIDDQLNDITVFDVLEDESGTLWFATLGNGVFRYDGENMIQYTVKSGLSSDQVMCIIEDKQGNVWFGTQGGISKFNGIQFENYDSKHGLSSDFVTSLLQDKMGNIWIGTRSGLCRFDGRLFAHFTTREGLSNDAVLSLWEDSNADELWIGTRMGLCKVNLKNVEAKLMQDVNPGFLTDDEVLFKTYDTKDGFLGIGCNLGAMQRMSDGKLWLGANNMLTAIKTSRLQYDIIAPSMSLVGLDLFNEEVGWQGAFSNPDTTIDLSNGVRVKNFRIDSLSRWFNIPQGLSLAHDNNNLTFRFQGITMHQPDKVKYRYKLVGFDKDWSAVTTENMAPYGNLPSGVYTFQVKAMNSEGVWSKPLEYAFSVRPPWWFTWWAYTLYVLSGFVLITVFLRWRDRAAILKRKMLQQKITEATKEIRHQKEVVEQQKEEVELQRQRSEELLLNILPQQVAEELKARGEAEARLIDNVSVLFTDFKGFTQLSEKLSPQLLVSQIHEYFSAFDAIISKHGIEKIKTIGDSYMAAGGLPVPNETHPIDVVSAAIEINQFMEKQRKIRESKGESFFEIRIGVHTGPVVAGIVGVKKFQYDIWGDTVNTASRMESAGQPGKINISEKTYELVKDDFECEYRGEIEAKGKEKMKMYFVLGKK